MKAWVPPKGLNKLYLQTNRMRWGLQVEDCSLTKTRPPSFPSPVPSLLSPQKQLIVGKRF